MKLGGSVGTGLSFGLASGVITTLGLMVGLDSGTHSQLAVLGGILTIAVADAFSDALGIHISEEAEGRHSRKEVWHSTIATFFTKFFVALIFAVPVLLLPLAAAVPASIAIGLFLIGCFSYFSARQQKLSPRAAVFEHLAIAVLVIALTHFVGDWIGKTLI